MDIVFNDQGKRFTACSGGHLFATPAPGRGGMIIIIIYISCFSTYDVCSLTLYSEKQQLATSRQFILPHRSEQIL